MSPGIAGVKRPARSDSDIASLKEWLNDPKNSFIVATASIEQKCDTAMRIQTNSWDERLNVQYEVRPPDKWKAMKKYEKFTVGSESIAVEQCILVRYAESEEDTIDLTAQWKAKVLEVRALDSWHVYIRVAWLNRPEDLVGRRQPHHGKNELIPTNQMDVIDAMAVNGSIEVAHWDERYDEGALMDEEGFFWRQTLDFAGTNTLSKLPLICIDSAPQNPDDPTLECSNEGCMKRFHAKCIEEGAVAQHDDNIGIARPLVSDKEQTVPTTAKVVKILEDNGSQQSTESTRIRVIYSNGVEQNLVVKCLSCGQQIK